MLKKLFPLTLGGLSIGTTEFGLMGILPLLAVTLDVSIPQAGNLISVYALGVVVGAPLLVSSLRRFNHVTSLIILSMLFFILNGICALVNDYYSLLLLRFLSGLPHGAFFGIGSVVASNLSPSDKQARAVSMMFLGLTTANLITVPLGTYLASTYHWKYTFTLMSAIGLITLLAIIFFLSKSSKISEPRVASTNKLFRKTEVWLILSMTAVGTAGTFAWISYIAPLLTGVTKINQSDIAGIMTVIGLGMVVGNLLGGILSDRIKASKASLLLLGLISLMFLLIYFVAPCSLLLLLVIFITACLSMAIAAPIQIMIMAHADSAKSLAAASTQSAFNIANALGAALGGIPLTLGYSPRSPQLVACVLALTGTGIAYALCRIEKKTAQKAL